MKPLTRAVHVRHHWVIHIIGHEAVPAGPGEISLPIGDREEIAIDVGIAWPKIYLSVVVYGISL